VKIGPNGRLTVAVHVDDLLLTSTSRELQKWFEEELRSQFEITMQYDNISYIGLNVSQNKNELLITQTKHIKDLVKRYNVTNMRKYPKTPTGSNLLSTDTKSGLVDKSTYLSLIMSLIYIGRLTRPDILMPVSYLATKSSNPTADDYGKCLRIVKYLAGTPTQALRYTRGRRINSELHADASHALHFTGHGHGGMVIKVGNCIVFCRSFKLKSITRSSSESELVTLDNSVTYAIWIMQLLEDLGYPQHEPIPIYQDNKSTIIMATKGGTFKRTKHITWKYEFINEAIADGVISLHYLPTYKMLDDMLTKPLSGPKLQKSLREMGIAQD